MTHSFLDGALAVSVGADCVDGFVADIHRRGWGVAQVAAGRGVFRLSERTVLVVPRVLDCVAADLARRKLEFSYRNNKELPCVIATA